MKSTLFQTAALTLAPLTLCAKEAAPPHVFIILMDDLGYGDLGSYGQKLIETPHLDRLAKEGMRFTHHYSAAPVSAPSRCMMLTGKHAGHAAVRENNEYAKRGNVWSHKAMLENPKLEGQGPMPADTRTLAHLMQDAGYKTALIGKWGLGYPGSVSTPNKMGFDFFYGFNCQRQAHTYYPMFVYRNESREMLNNAPLLTPNDKLDAGADKYDDRSYDKFQRKEYVNDLFYDELIELVEQQPHHKKPLFVMWATPLPHVSLQAPRKWVDYYHKKFKEEEPYLGQQSYLPCRYPRATYAAMVSYFDDQVGRFIAKLKEKGMYENSLIIYTSDNGPTFNGGSASPWFQSAGPFRSEAGWGKASLREGGIRVPLLVSWPARIKKGRVSNHISASYDILPTIAEVVKKTAPADSDGLSFLAELTGKRQAEHDALYWEFPEGAGARAMRMGKWKGLILNTNKGNKKMQLFNLDRDEREENNLADRYPNIVAEIQQKMDEEHTKPIP